MAVKTTTFKIKGPMFESGTQITQGFAEAVNRGLLDMAQIEGANKVKDELYPGHGRITANLRNHIGASVTKDYEAQVDAGAHHLGANIIYSSWVEGISSRNKKSVFKGYGMFKNAYDHINNNPALYDKYIGDAIIEAFD
jgi:hypothetical protein